MADQIMAEGKAKKPGLLRRSMWGIWVILLTALLVLSFIFAAPWKVITLIAIFLVAATILPRIYRKWFWLAVGLVVLSFIVWIFLPDDNKGWRPYTFDKELAQLQARYAVPDSENAAIIYNQILADWKQKEANEPNLPECWYNLALKGPWLNKDQPEIAAYIQCHRNEIEALLRATKIEKCSFPIDSSSFTDFLEARADLLIASGNNDAAEGNTSEAVEKYLAALELGQHVRQQLESKFNFACEATGLGGINNIVVLGDANEFYLDKLEQAVSAIRYDWNSDFLDSITLDKLRLKNELGSSFYEVNPKGNVRLIRGSSAKSAKSRENLRKKLAVSTIDNPETKAKLQKLTTEPGYWQRKFIKAYLQFYVPATPEKLGKLVDASFEKYYAMAKPDFKWSGKPDRVSIFQFQFIIDFRWLIQLHTSINKEVYFRIHDHYLRKSAEQRGTLLLIAMRRYKNANGHWPDSLDDVKTLVSAETFIDPMNNGSLVYKRTDDGFTLYGKGKNGIDDGGKGYSNAEDKGEPDDLMIWPTRNKIPKQQEQKANE
ncbi:MAG: hypothetical protein ABSG97_05335 [Sedimentisphaerales bacterium]|jgi:hypothetical protein